MARAKSFLNDFFSVVKSRAAVVVFTLGVNIITARSLGPAANGVIAALTVYPLLFMNFGSLGIQQSTTYLTGQGTYRIEEIYGSVLVILVFTSILSLLSCYFLIRLFSKAVYSNALIFLAIVSIPSFLYNTYCAGLFLGRQKIQEFNKVSWLYAAFNFGFTALFILVFKLGITGSLLASVFACVLMSAIVFKSLNILGVGKPAFSRAATCQMMRFGVVYALSYLVTFLNYKLDIVLLEKWSNSYELGIYAKGAGLVEYLWSIPLLLSTLIFSRSVNAEDPKEFSLKACRLLRFAAVGISVAILLLFLLSAFLVDVLYGPAFAGSVAVLKILIPGVLLLTIFRVLNMDIHGRGKPHLSLVAMLPAVVINVVLNYLLIPGYGANGSSFASTISYSVAAIIFLIMYSRVVQIPISVILRYTKEDKEVALAYYAQLVKKVKRRDKDNNGATVAATKSSEVAA